jgi:Holliday junction resolvasome RuvABC ATP-dependent DNA helicase subunit
MMNKDTTGTKGLELLIKKYREKFRISENLNYYSDEDLKKAEKKFLKHVLGHSQY